ncbi:MAG: tetratricopeptide repeat protein [Fimbriimonadales bacterium]|nr:tetratricopeptide repeat protein [Fimbriimonadales bacterium]
MHRRNLFWALGLAVVIVMGGGLLMLRRDLRPTVTLPNGTRVTFLKATYGRHHVHTEWRFQWAWPPIQRDVHSVHTPADSLRLWFLVKTSQPLHSPMFPHSLAIAADGSLCGGNIDTKGWQQNPSGALTAIINAGYEGLPADGSTVELRFYAPNLPESQSPASFRVRLPRAAVLDRVKQPETFPIQRSGKQLKVRLNGFRWLYYRWKVATAIPVDEEYIEACPDWQLAPLTGSPDEWEIVNIHFAPLGAGPVHPMLNRVFGASPQTLSATVMGGWNAPIYCFFAQFEHKLTGKRESFEFYVPPPPAEPLRRQGQLEAQARAAIQQGDYARAIKVWENAPAEFALQAHYWRGYAYAMQGDYERAVAEFRQASRRLRSVTSPYDNEYEVRPALALCLLLMGRRADATQIAREFVEQVYQEQECLWEVEPLVWGLCLLLPEVAPASERVEQRVREWVQQGQQRQNQVYVEMALRARAVQVAVERDDLAQELDRQQRLALGLLLDDDLR